MEENTKGRATSTHIKELEERARKLQYTNNRLQQELFHVSQRGNRLAVSLGFSSIEDAEAALAEQPNLFKQKPAEQSASRITFLEEQLAKYVQLDIESQSALGDAFLEIHKLERECNTLRKERNAAKDENTELKCKVRDLERRQGARTKMRNHSFSLPTPSTTVSKKRPLLEDESPIPRLRQRIYGDDSVTNSDPRESILMPVAPVVRPTILDSDDPIILRAALQTLNIQHEALREKHRSASEKYANDYRLWRDFKRWIFGDQDEPLSAVLMDNDVPNRERISRILNSKEFKIGSSGPSTLSKRKHERQFKKKKALATPIVDLEDDAVVVTGNDDDKAQPPSSLTAKFLEIQRSTRALETKAMSKNPSMCPPSTPEDTVVNPSSSPSVDNGHKRKFGDTPSSETEEDSQAPEPVYATQPGLVRRMFPDVSPSRADPPSPSGMPASPNTPRSKRCGMLPGTPRKTPKKSPRKRSSVDPLSPSSHNSTPRKALRIALSPSSRHSTPRKADKENGEGPSTVQRHPADYSAFKGRGRYAAAGANAEKALNALYEVDRSRNEGRAFQYDEVVRDKEARKHLHAVDCECCKDYYEAAGPLPPRLQPPLWRSPQATPSSTASDAHGHLRPSSDATTAAGPNGHDPDFDKDIQKVIEGHKHQISRHREQWTRPPTPPGYWNIGFPDTQEAAAINARAREMHAQKRARVESEASRGGRFKRR